MRRLFALVAVVLTVVAASALVARLNRDERYRELMAAGDLELRAGRNYGAIEAYSGALAVRPDSMAAHLRRGEAYRAQRRDEEAVRDLREAIRLEPQATSPLLALGELYEARGDAARAAEWYGEAARLLPDRDLLYRLALAHYRSGNPAAAREPLRQAIAADDAFAEGHYLLGLVLRDTGNSDGTALHLGRAVRLKPTLVAAREELADLHRGQGALVAEMTQLQALAAADADPSREIAIALAESRRGQFAPALATLQSAAARAPNDSRVHLAVGRVLLARAERTNDRELATSAITAFEQALGGSARRSEGLALYGRALFLAGEPDEAERILREAVSTSPFELMAFAYLADAAEALGHHAEALDALRRLEVLQGDTVAADVRAARSSRIGALALAAGDPRLALGALDRAMAGGLRDAATLGFVAEARWQVGQTEAAREALDAALALEPRNATLLRLRRTIRE